jgi:hypothetical protein
MSLWNSSKISMVFPHSENVIIPLDARPVGGNIDIMRTPQFQIDTLREYFRDHRIGTVEELQRSLANPSARTVFRKLEALESLSSYSHRGQYYTLPSIARFDEQGLWTQRDVWFSCFGNLLDTAEAFVKRSETGYRAVELSEALHVDCKHTLVELVRRQRLEREHIEGSYVYLATDRRQRSRQRRLRRQRLSSPRLLVTNPDLATDEAKAAIILFLTGLDERQRRLYAGLESLKLGVGGDEHIAELFGIDRHTVARGREELIEATESPEGVRRAGGGRPAAEKKRRKS